MNNHTETIIKDFANRVTSSIAGRDSQAFVPLTSRIVTAQFENALAALLHGDTAEAQAHISTLNALGLHFQLVRYADPHHDDLLTGFVEHARPGTAAYRGWGGVVVRSAGGRRRVYGAPHVRSDTYTLEIALRAFVDDPNAQAVVVAGAHRYANGEDPPVADVTRTSTNLFHALTAFLAHTAQSAGAPLWFIQFHGAADRSMQPAITASNGTDDPGWTADAPLVQIKSRMAQHGVEMGVCGWEDDDGPYVLCGTQNIQGLLLEHMGLRANFMHIEFERKLRSAYHNRDEPGMSQLQHFLDATREVLDNASLNRLLVPDDE